MFNLNFDFLPLPHHHLQRITIARQLGLSNATDLA